MTAYAENLKAALLSVLVSAIGLLTVILLMAGQNEFGSMALQNLGMVALVSPFAGIARLMVSKRGWIPTALCGLIVAALGCGAAVLVALSTIQPAP